MGILQKEMGFLMQCLAVHPQVLENRKHTGSSSSGFGGNFPNENYAREIRQLFSIGLLKLHDDGSAQRDAAGEVLLVGGLRVPNAPLQFAMSVSSQIVWTPCRTTSSCT